MPPHARLGRVGTDLTSAESLQGGGTQRHRLVGKHRVRPSPHPAVLAYPIDDELVVFDPRSGEAHVLNRTGAYVWSLCDGTRSFEAPASALAEAYVLDAGTARRD